MENNTDHYLCQIDHKFQYFHYILVHLLLQSQFYIQDYIMMNLNINYKLNITFVLLQDIYNMQVDNAYLKHQ